ncbi:hypothetical protein, partial [Archangium violaceum]|uniref:hypothetical protein n=1 Tax=Archangium violaceum TaxID=83451 RepID=UPI00126A0744
MDTKLREVISSLDLEQKLLDPGVKASHLAAALASLGLAPWAPVWRNLGNYQVSASDGMTSGSNRKAVYSLGSNAVVEQNACNLADKPGYVRISYKQLRELQPEDKLTLVALGGPGVFGGFTPTDLAVYLKRANVTGLGTLSLKGRSSSAFAGDLLRALEQQDITVKRITARNKPVTITAQGRALAWDGERWLHKAKGSKVEASRVGQEVVVKEIYSHDEALEEGIGSVREWMNAGSLSFRVVDAKSTLESLLDASGLSRTLATARDAFQSFERALDVVEKTGLDASKSKARDGTPLVAIVKTLSRELSTLSACVAEAGPSPDVSRLGPLLDALCWIASQWAAATESNDVESELLSTRRGAIGQLVGELGRLDTGISCLREAVIATLLWPELEVPTSTKKELTSFCREARIDPKSLEKLLEDLQDQKWMRTDTSRSIAVYKVMPGYYQYLLKKYPEQLALLNAALDYLQQRSIRHENRAEVYNSLREKLRRDTYRDWFHQFATTVGLLAANTTLPKPEMVKLLKLSLTQFQFNATYSVEDSV